MQRAAYPVRDEFKRCKRSVVAIASSTGGPACLQTLLSHFSRDVRASFVIVQHMAEGFEENLANWLAGASRLDIRVAAENDPLKNGVVYLSPAGLHMLVTPSRTIHLEDSPPLLHQKPSANLLLSSVAKVCGSSSIGVVLTGMGEDGALGLRDIKIAGGATIAQDEATSVVYGMPQAAVHLQVVDAILPIGSVAPHIDCLLRWGCENAEAASGSPDRGAS